MAPKAKGKEAKEPKAKNGKRRGEDEAPEGFDSISSERAPWIVKEPGLIVMGLLLGRYSFTGKGDKKTRYFYQLELTTDGIPCVSGSGDEQEEVTCNRGDRISIGETFAMERDLSPYVGDGGQYEVWIRFGEPERDRQNKPTFWPVKLAKKTLRAPTRTPQNVSGNRSRRDEDESDERNDEDFPF